MNHEARPAFGPRDERRHDLADAAAAEVWTLDFVHEDANVGGSFCLAIGGDPEVAGFHASVVRLGEPLVTLSETAAAAPRPPGLELRSPGLWTEIGIQTAWDHVTVDLEAFAVALDDPDEVFGRAYGDRVALGAELEWEQADPVVSAGHGYAVACRVHGDLLLADDVIAIDGWGWRSHEWCAEGYTPSFLVAGRRNDGSWWHDETPSSDGRTALFDLIGRAPIAQLVAGLDIGIDQRLVRGPDGAIAWTRQAI